MAVAEIESAAPAEGARPPCAAKRLAAPLPMLRRGVGRRLLALILVFSSLVTLVTTLVQLYLDYRRDLGAIEGRMAEIESSYLDSLAGSLWNVDLVQLKVQLDGIVRLPDMQAAEVRELMAGLDRSLVVASGESLGHSVIAREFPIVYVDRGAPRTIGVLRVEASLDQVWARIFDRAVYIGVSQGIKTFLVSLFILYIVHRLLTRHLVAIASYLDTYDIDAGRRLALHRTRPGHEDELDQVVEAFNTMSAGLQEAYSDLRELNAELERDIAARRQAEEEVIRLNAVLEQRVRQRTAELEAANSELGAFAYSVSHDLRAPLRRIEGFSQILIGEYGGRLDERGTHYLDRIRAGAHDMAEMIDSFLRMARSTRGELSIERLDLSAMVEDVLARLREKEPERRVEAEVQPGIVVDGDRRLMKVALENLVGNAWKYTRRTERAAIAFGARTGADGRTVYFLSDNGAGFDMSYVGRLFTPFSRLHRPEDFEGSGIGLATVQRILARHGGRIWAEAAPGKGATFEFTCWETRGTDEQQP